MKETLDFLVIGAQKCGTTSLFELLRQHPSIYIPPAKEAPFFGKKDSEEKGWKWYLNEFFSCIEENKKWGTITPQYMSWPNVAVNIFRTNPETKIIAILRDPFERAFSHYQMSKRRSYETRSYYEAIEQLRTEGELSRSRTIATETNSYIIRGEYGRILTEYKNFFPVENILILFTDDLKQNSKTTIKKIFSFLNLPHISVIGLDKRHHVGSSKPKLKAINDVMALMKRSESLKAVLKKAISKKVIDRVWYEIDRWNIKRDTCDNRVEIDQMLTETYPILKEIYKKDAALFLKEFGYKFPWHDKCMR